MMLLDVVHEHRLPWEVCPVNGSFNVVASDGAVVALSCRDREAAESVVSAAEFAVDEEIQELVAQLPPYFRDNFVPSSRLDPQLELPLLQVA